MSEAPAKPSRLRGAWWVVALLLPALWVRGCALRSFEVKSGSMAPAFEVGDRLLALQDGIDARTLQRWDVAVFDAEVDAEIASFAETVLKRVVGLPGDWIELRGGDVWLGPAGDQRIARKPDALIGELLSVVHVGRGFEEPWLWVGPGEASDVEGGTRVVVPANGKGLARFAQTIDDGFDDVEGDEIVGDTALRVTFGEGDGIPWLVLREGSDVFEARLAPADRGGATLRHLIDGVVSEDADFGGVAAGSTVEMWNVDGALRVFVDGRLVLTADDVGEISPTPRLNAPLLAVEDGARTIGEVVVLRDVHLSAQGTFGVRDDGSLGLPYPVPPGHVFLLGDRSARSRDSRYFGAVPLSERLGRPIARYGPSERRAWLAPDGSTDAR